MFSSSTICLNKLSVLFSLLFWYAYYSYSALSDGVVLRELFFVCFFPFFLCSNLSSFSLCIISRFLSLVSLIPFSIWFALFPMIASWCFISFIEFFISRISVWFFFKGSISLVKYSLCSLNCFLRLPNFLSVFSHNLLSIFRTAILASLSFMSHIYKCLFVFWRFFLSFPSCFFPLVIHGIWWILSLSRDQCVGGTSLADWYEGIFLLFSSRWHWMIRFLALWNPRAVSCSVCCQCSHGVSGWSGLGGIRQLLCCFALMVMATSGLCGVPSALCSDPGMVTWFTLCSGRNVIL